MPSVAVHLDKANHNQKFLQTVETAKVDFLDWAVVVLFYQALHLVEAWFAHSLGLHNIRHADRNRAVSTHLRPFAPAYLRLYNRARIARYEPFHITVSEYRRLMRADFQPLADHIRNALR